MSYDKLFEGLSDALRILQDKRSVVVVGNGPMSGNLGPQIEKVITSEETYTSTMALLCFSGCFLCICLVAIWFEIGVRGLPQTLIRSACNLNMLSIVSGQEVGKQDERDRK